MTGWKEIRGPLLFAHRGARVDLAENSLPAYRRALELGADALEMDVRMTSDGQMVAFHDPSGARVAGVDRQISDCTLSEVRSWEISSGPAAAGGERLPVGQQVQVPTLKEVLQQLPRALLNVDIKAPGPAAAERTVELVESQGASDRVLLTSFHLSTLSRVRGLGYRGPVGLSRPEVAMAALLPLFALRGVQVRYRRAQIPVDFGPLPLDGRGLIEKLHSLGLAVDYWVVNDPGKAERLLEQGADGIVADDVAAIAELFRRSPRTAAWRERQSAR